MRTNRLDRDRIRSDTFRTAVRIPFSNPQTRIASMKPGHPSNAASRFVLAVAVTVLSACASTSLTSSWQSPEYRGGPLKNIAVFVVAKDEAVQRFAEDQVVRTMPAGTRATAGYTLFDKPGQDKETVRAALIKAGFDGVLVSRLVAVDKSQTYVPPQVHFVRTAPAVIASPYYGNFGGYYGHGYAVMQTTPGYTVENTTVVVETVLYTLPDDKPVWTGTTQTIDPRSRPEMIEAITQLVEAEMRKRGLIGNVAK
jgi:hypothetical protein